MNTVDEEARRLDDLFEQIRYMRKVSEEKREWERQTMEQKTAEKVAREKQARIAKIRGLLKDATENFRKVLLPDSKIRRFFLESSPWNVRCVESSKMMEAAYLISSFNQDTATYFNVVLVFPDPGIGGHEIDAGEVRVVKAEIDSVFGWRWTDIEDPNDDRVIRELTQFEYTSVVERTLVALAIKSK